MCGAVFYNTNKRQNYIKDCDGQGFLNNTCDKSFNVKYTLSFHMCIYIKKIFKCKSQGCLKISRHQTDIAIHYKNNTLNFEIIIYSFQFLISSY